jgi:ketosteroid isomerase-like protein
MIMKRKIALSGCLLIVVLLLANRIYSQTPAEYKTKIEALNKEMAKSMLAGDTEKNLSLYTTDAISMPSYEPMHTGIDAIRKSSEEMKKSGWKCLSFEPTTLKVIVNGSMITEIGSYKISMSMPGMDKPMDDHGKYLTIWDKQKDGSLKIKVETWNTDVNPMAMMDDMKKK